MINLKEYKFSENNFIKGWFVPEYVCDGVLNHFHNMKEHHKTGTAAAKSTDFKKSTDFYVHHLESIDAVAEYRNHLQWCLEQYVKYYIELQTDIAHFNINIPYNIQHYKVNEGFKKWHWERSDLASAERVLVFMTYLNNVEDGGTEFKYQNLITPAKKGLTLIWPTDFTHTHRGIISKTKEKYIVTGWYTFTKTNIGKINYE